MGLIKLKTVDTSAAWRANGRYKVNDVRSLDGESYQNITGKNSIPTDLIDWIKSSPNPNIESPPITFTALSTGIGQSFSPVPTKPRLVFKSSGYMRETGNWSYSGNTITFLASLNTGNTIDLIF